MIDLGIGFDFRIIIAAVLSLPASQAAFTKPNTNSVMGIINIIWTPEWLDALSALVRSIVEVAEACRTILYLIGKLLGN